MSLDRSSPANAWSSRQQIPLLRGVRWLVRGVPANRSRYCVEFPGYSVEFTPTDPATAWSSAASAWSSRQQTPLQRGVPRLQRGVPADRPCYSVEFGGYSVEFTPADPATAWSSAATAWSSTAWSSGYCVEFAPPQRGVPRLAPAWSSPAGPATAWSPRQQTPLLRGVRPAERAERRSRHV